MKALPNEDSRDLAEKNGWSEAFAEGYLDGRAARTRGTQSATYPLGNLDEYRQGFLGPGKLDGSVVNWVNGALLRAVGARTGYDVHFAPFRYRAGSRTRTLYTARLEGGRPWHGPT